MSAEGAGNQNLIRLIRHQIRQGQKREQIFHSLCLHLNYKPLKEEDVNEQFEDFDNGYVIKFEDEQAEQKHNDLLELVGSQYRELKNKIAEWNKNACARIELLNDRYALGMKFADKKLLFVLSDMFHCESKELSIDFEVRVPENYTSFALFSINLKQFLLIEQRNDEQGIYHMNIYLLQLNVQELKVEQMNKKSIEGRYKRLVLDHNDPAKFLLMLETDSNANLRAHMGFIQNSRIFIEERYFEADETDHRIEYFAFKLDDQLLELLFLDSRSECETNLCFGNLILDGQSAEYEKICEIEVTRDEMYERDEEFSGYAWTRTKCFLAEDICESFFEIYELDLDEYKIEERGMKNAGRCVDMRLDNGFLNVCSFDEEKYSLYRFRISEPDTLRNICWFNIRKHALFFGSKLYENVMKQLPSNLRPFGAFLDENCLFKNLMEASTSPEEPELKRKKSI